MDSKKEIKECTEQEEAPESGYKNAVCYKDEYGEKCIIAHYGPINIPYSFLKSKSENIQLDPLTTKLRDDDIFLFTYLRTGSHWVVNLLHFLLRSGPLDKIKSLTPVPVMENLSEEAAASMPSPRVLHSHALPDRVQPEIFKKGRKIIMTVRNPKDTAVSMFHLSKVCPFLGPIKISWNCFIELWTKGLVPFHGFFHYYKEWNAFLQKLEGIDVLIVSYETLRENPLSEIKRIQNYLGLSHSDQRLQEVLDRCSLAKLKDDANTKYTESPVDFKVNLSYVYRKGEVGEWKNYFTVAQSEEIDARLEEMPPANIFKLKI